MTCLPARGRETGSPYLSARRDRPHIAALTRARFEAVAKMASFQDSTVLDYRGKPANKAKKKVAKETHRPRSFNRGICQRIGLFPSGLALMNVLRFPATMVSSEN